MRIVAFLFLAATAGVADLLAPHLPPALGSAMLFGGLALAIDFYLSFLAKTAKGKEAP